MTSLNLLFSKEKPTSAIKREEEIILTSKESPMIIPAQNGFFLRKRYRLNSSKAVAIGSVAILVPCVTQIGGKNAKNAVVFKLLVKRKIKYMARIELKIEIKTEDATGFIKIDIRTIKIGYPGKSLISWAEKEEVLMKPSLSAYA